MKEMTPMKRYKSSIDKLRNQLSSVTREVALNKSESKHIPWPYSRNGETSTKGVESDFILIFQDRANPDLSFAFTFEYIDKTPEQQTVSGSIKYGDKDGELKMGSPMNMEEFRTSLSSFNKNLEEIRLKGKMEFNLVIEKFSETFLKAEFKLSNELKNASKSVATFLKNKASELNLNSLEKMVEVTQSAREEAEINIGKKIKLSPAYKEREKLIERLKQLDKMLDTSKILFEKEESLGEKKRLELEAKRNLDNANKKLDNHFNSEIAKYPNAVKSRIKKTI